MSQSDSDLGDVVQRRTLQLVTEALDLLDAHGGPAEAATYLALAQQRLLEETASDDPLAAKTDKTSASAASQSGH
jgi:hypothetical protein